MRLQTSCFLALLVSAFADSAYAQQPTGRPLDGVPVGPDGACPAGTTEIRPRICRAPQAPAPSILDYRPHSTLISEHHFVPRAKYPAIDYHGHPQDLINSAEGLERLGNALDSINVRLMVAADFISGERLQKAAALIKASPRM
jgi:hypothetical protein